MSRKVFFSYHHTRDAWRAAQVRNSDLLADEDEHGFIDGAEWQKLKSRGDDVVKRWIQDQLHNTSVSVVLIGAETANRRWVQYEIIESWNRGNGMVGVTIHGIRDQNLRTDHPGINPFDVLKFDGGRGRPMSSVVYRYDWIRDNGRQNLGQWIEEAYQNRR